jgi:hypothetical protein
VTLDLNKPDTLDLNVPSDAKEYIQGWIEHGGLTYEDPDAFFGEADEHHLMVAKQLFLYVDPRPALGSSH